MGQLSENEFIFQFGFNKRQVLSEYYESSTTNNHLFRNNHSIVHTEFTNSNFATLTIDQFVVLHLDENDILVVHAKYFLTSGGVLFFSFQWKENTQPSLDQS